MMVRDAMMMIEREKCDVPPASLGPPNSLTITIYISSIRREI